VKGLLLQNICMEIRELKKERISAD
jgi:hypothetical protein